MGKLVIYVDSLSRGGAEHVSVTVADYAAHHGMANYDSKNLICWPLRKFMKQIFVDVLSVVCFSFCVRFLNLQAQNYLQWIYNAVKVVTVAVAITGVINWIFYRDKEKKLLSKIIKR